MFKLILLIITLNACGFQGSLYLPDSKIPNKNYGPLDSFKQKSSNESMIKK